MEIDNKHNLRVYIYSQGAESIPPLGTILGNLGVNSTAFCKEFNLFTSELPNYIKLTVDITILSNRSYKFLVIGLSLGFIISLLKFERSIRYRGKTIVQQCITLKSIIQLALFRFPELPLIYSFPVLLGMIKSCNLIIIYKLNYKI